MILTTKNLGKIRTATIDLSKPLIVFCGPNGTGKTYLSYLIDHIFSSVGSYMCKSKSLSKSQIEVLHNEGELHVQIEKSDVANYLNQLCETGKSSLGDLFALSDEDVKRLFPNFFVESILTDADDLVSVDFSCNVIANSGKYHITKNCGDLFVSVKYVSIAKDNDALSVVINDTYERHMLYSQIYNRLIESMLGGVTMLPVERNSIYTFNKELSLSRNMVIDHVQKLVNNEEVNPLDFLRQRTRRYPKAIVEGLAVANDLNTIKKKQGFYYDLASDVEQNLLQGVLDTNSEGDVVYKMTKTKKLPIQITSSMVKTIASLIFYVKYIAKKGETIIIDEPEMNLHPANQVLLAETIIKFMKAGLHFVISTHSDYIVREINKYIMLHNVLDKHGDCPDGFNKELALPINDVDIYNFYPSRSDQKVSVECIRQDSEGCYSIDSIDQTINQQNEELNILFEKLYS